MSALTQEPEPWQDAMSESTPSHNRSGQQQHDVTVRDSPVKPTPAGGVGQPNLPLGDVTLRDKIVGKTQKVIGKLSNNPELHEKGEVRELGGKDAARGEARALHD